VRRIYQQYNNLLPPLLLELLLLYAVVQGVTNNLQYLYTGVGTCSTGIWINNIIHFRVMTWTLRANTLAHVKLFGKKKTVKLFTYVKSSFEKNSVLRLIFEKCSINNCHNWQFYQTIKVQMFIKGGFIQVLKTFFGFQFWFW